MDRIWSDARSIGDLGGAMAGWLQGSVPERPGYELDRPSRPSPETEHLLPVLIRLNLRGWVTTESQPGVQDVTDDGTPYAQRAYVQGWIADDDPLLVRVVRGAREMGLLVSAYGSGKTVGPQKGFPVGREGDTVHKPLGGRPGFGEHRASLPGVGRRARRHLRRHGVLLTVVDPRWGRRSRIAFVLNRICNGQTLGQTTDQRVRN